LSRPLILSYAQNGEDVVLSRAFADQQFGFYVDIGACHPVEDSVTLHFYERGWRGVNVEPDRELHVLFPEARPRDSNLCAAVGRPRGRVAFHPTGTRGHGTLDATLASARGAGRAAERVPAMLLSDVIDCYGPDEGEIDFLKIDVEGGEAGVIASGDWMRHRPRVLVIEAVDDKGNPTYEAWEPDLLGAGYRFALFDGLNRFYCRDEEAGLLLPRLGAPANIRDGWIRAGDAHAHEAIIPLQEAVTRLRAELDAAARQAVEADNRSNALNADLEEAHAKVRVVHDRLEEALARERVIQDRLEDATAGARRLRAELDTALNRYEALVVDAARARAEAAAALRREEAAEARMASLEMDHIHREADDRVLRARSLFGRLFFRPDGRPVKPLRRLLFHTSGAPRRFLRVLVLHKNGAPRRAFAHWMRSTEYLGLSNPVKRPGHRVTERDDAATAS
jgi:FkbM family methyltransferase